MCIQFPAVVIFCSSYTKQKQVNRTIFKATLYVINIENNKYNYQHIRELTSTQTEVSIFSLAEPITSSGSTSFKNDVFVSYALCRI